MVIILALVAIVKRFPQEAAGLAAIAAAVAGYFLVRRNPKPLTVVVVGGGVSGLYTAYMMYHMGYPVTLIEVRARFGGRAYMQHWHGNNIEFGAGVVRLGDTRLRALVRRLGLTLGTFATTMGYHWRGPKYTPSELTDIVSYIRSAYERDPEAAAGVRMQDFVTRVLDGSPYSAESFTRHMAYTDWLDASVPDTIYNYPLSDVNYATDVSIIKPNGWTSLTDALNCGFDARALTCCTKVSSDDHKFTVHTNYGDLFCDCVVLALDQPGLQKIVSESPGIRPVQSLLDCVGHVPFTRAYTYHEDEFPEIIGSPGVSMDNEKIPANFVLTDEMSQRIVPFDSHVIMSVYADGAYALKWRDIYSSELATKTAILSSLQNTLTGLSIPPISDEVHIFWQAGVHYYRPYNGLNADPTHRKRDLVRRFVNPIRGLYLAGEMFSVNQGWTEGAVESAERAVKVFRRAS